MKIKDMFEQKRTVFSMEIFPPKFDMPVESIYATLDGLKGLEPDYISVTYGAGGKSKDRTVEIARKIREEYGIESMAHLTCISHSKEEVAKLITDLKNAGIENVLALRGDIPEDPDFQFPTPLHYEHASQLVSELKRDGGFSIGAACYPECHPDCVNLKTDIKNLKHKVDCGADFLVSQLFFDNEEFFEFMEKLEIAGIDIPVEAGIMPVLNKNQILRMCKLSGCKVPKKLQRMLDRFGDDPQSLREAGEAYATEQIIDLVTGGVRGIHLYSMNKPDVSKRIWDNIQSIRRFTK